MYLIIWKFSEIVSIHKINSFYNALFILVIIKMYIYTSSNW